MIFCQTCCALAWLQVCDKSISSQKRMISSLTSIMGREVTRTLLDWQRTRLLLVMNLQRARNHPDEEAQTADSASAPCPSPGSSTQPTDPTELGGTGAMQQAAGSVSTANQSPAPTPASQTKELSEAGAVQQAAGSASATDSSPSPQAMQPVMAHSAMIQTKDRSHSEEAAGKLAASQM